MSENLIGTAVRVIPNHKESLIDETEVGGLIIAKEDCTTEGRNKGWEGYRIVYWIPNDGSGSKEYTLRNAHKGGDGCYRGT